MDYGQVERIPQTGIANGAGDKPTSGGLAATRAVARGRPWTPILAGLLFALASLVPAHAAPRHAAIVVDANTGAVLHDSAADAPRFPASLTKMMTLYMVFEQIERGKLGYASRIPISANAAATPPSKLGLEPGDTISVADAVKSLITKSANDIAVAVAEHIAGSERRFAALMTERAHQLGMKSTTFRNASGLPDEEQLTTARDMIKLALSLQDTFPRHYRQFATRRFSYAGKTYRNHNTLLFNFAGTEGIKTGYTRASGFNLVASVRRDGRHVVGAVFGGSRASARDARMRALLAMALRKAAPVKTRKPALVATAVPRPARAGRQRIAQAAPALPQRPALEPPVELARGQTAPTIAPPMPARPEAAPVAAAAPATISLARVRPIDVLAAHRARTASRPRNETIVAKSNVMTPNGAAQFARLPVSEADTAPPAALRASEPGNAMVIPPPGLGAPPSTLQAQALALAGHDTRPTPAAGRFAPPSALGLRPARTPEPAARPSLRDGGYHVQIGAYGSAPEAERQLAAVRARAADLLGAYQPLAVPVQQAGKTLYRARYAGFDAGAAARTCTALRRQQVDCFVAKAAP